MAKKKARQPDGTVVNPELPSISPITALIFAKLLHAGCPGPRAVQYIIKLSTNEHAVETIADICNKTASAWRLDPLVVEASNELTGGAWFDLTKEQRYQLALDKMHAEAALWSWENSWVTAYGKDDLEKMRQAREMLKQELGKSVASDDPLTAFARFAMDLTQQMTQQATAQKLAKSKTPAPLADASESVMITHGSKHKH